MKASLEETPTHRASAVPGLLLGVLGSVSLVWGLNWVVMKATLAYIGPLQFAALRLWLAALFLFGCLALLRKPLRVSRPWTVATTGLFQTGICTALTLWALAAGDAGKNAVLCYTMPFWVMLLAWPVLGERPSRRQWLALALAAAGLALLLAGGIAGTLADLAATGAGFTWAVGIVLTKRLNAAQANDPFAFSAWQSLIGALFLGALVLGFPEGQVQWTATLGFALAYNALLVYGLMWFAWFWVLQRLDAGIASLGTLAVPLIGVLAGVAFLGERPTPLEWAGMAAIATALLITASAASRRH
jgi:drug/metabolite transporter (DMT)-like permease